MSGRPPLKPRLVTACECGNHAFTTLTTWGIALVSPEDAHFLEEQAWCLSGAVSNPYVSCHRNGRNIKLHRLVLPPTPGTRPDHRFGATLDNRRSELRLLTHAENCRNRRKPPISGSGYFGVRRHEYKGLWRANFWHGGKNVYLGYFSCPIEAAKARDAAVLAHFGDIARLNFPEALHV